MTPWRTRPDLLRLGALALIAAALWIAVTGKWSAEAWRTPASYSVDALETLARFQIAHEHGAGLALHPHIERLGAPGGADWSGYPLPDFAWYWLAGKFVGALGLIPASNLMLLLAHVAATLAFFACARLLGHRPLLAAGAALLFGYCFSVFYRGLSHHSFALAFAVPPAWLTVWLVASSRLLVTGPAGCALCIASGVLIGGGNPYFIYFFGVLLMLALGWQLIAHRRRANLIAGLLAGAACLATFAVTNLAFLRASAAGLYARSADQSTLYGLRLLDLVAPPANHHSALAGEWGRNYAAGRGGEPFAAYLGIVAAAGLAALLVGAVIRLVRARRVSPLALWALWVLAFASAGGVNTWLAKLGLDQFRASNRYSIHLLALALFFLAGWGSRATRSWSRGARLALVGSIVLLGLWDTIPRADAPEHQQRLRAAAEADVRTGRLLEDQLPSQAIFQLPIAVFPEQGPIGAMADYELLRPFLWTRTARFSYGGLATAPDQTWQRNVAQLPPALMAATLEQAGFGALYVRRDAFADRAKALETALAASGRERLIDQDQQLVFRLRPAASPTPPSSSDPLYHLNWNGTPPSPAQSAILLGAGWFPLERDDTRAWRWAGAKATLFVYLAGGKTGTLRLDGELTAVAPTRLTFQVGSTWHEQPLHASQPTSFSLTFPLHAGMNALHLSADLRPRRAGPTDARMLGFNLANLRAAFLPDRPE